MGNSTEDYLDNLLKEAIAMDEGDYDIEPEPDDLIQDFIGESEPEEKVVIADFDAVEPDDSEQSNQDNGEELISDDQKNNAMDMDLLFADMDKLLEEANAESLLSDSEPESQNTMLEEDTFADQDIAMTDGLSDVQDIMPQDNIFSSQDIPTEGDSMDESSFADEEIDNLLGSLGELDNMFSNLGSNTDLTGLSDDGVPENVANNEPEPTRVEDIDLDALLAGLGEEDSELSEIGNLLEKDANSEIVDEETLEKLFNEDIDADNYDIDSLLEDEPVKETKEEKKRRKKEEKAAKKLARKMAKANPEADDNPEGLVNSDGIEGLEEKKQKESFFSKLFAAFGDDDEDESDKKVFETDAVDLAAEGAAENAAILDELDELGEESGKGKKKKKKKKKDKKGKDQGEESGEEEENPKEKKKKEKKEKKEKKKKEPAPPLKKLPVKKIIVISIFIFSIGAVVVVFSYFYPYSKDIREARKYYVTGNYQETYNYLHGHKLTEEDKEMYDKNLVLLKLQRQIDSYNNYMKMGKRPEALNALIQGIDAMDTYADKANEMGIMNEYSSLATTIVTNLNNTFGMDVAVAREWIANEGTSEYMRNIYEYLGLSQTENNVSKTDNNNVYTPDIQIIVDSETEDNEAEGQL